MHPGTPHLSIDNSLSPPPYTPNEQEVLYQLPTSALDLNASGSLTPSHWQTDVSDSSGGIPRAAQGPRHLYYRVYSPPDGPVEVKHPKSPEDPFLGCTLVNQITPPHTAANIKQHLSRREAIADWTSTSLFADISCRAPLDDTEFLDTRNPASPGANSGEPVALVMSTPATSPSAPAAASTSDLQQPWDNPPIRARCFTVRTLRDLHNPVVPARDLSFNKGDILYTTGNVRAAGTPAAHIYAKADDGRMGLVWVRDVEFVGLAPPALLGRGRAGRRFGGRHLGRRFLG